MDSVTKFQEILPEDVTSLLKKHHFSLMPSFYETQSSFLTEIYKRYGDIQTANIILCFAKNTHLEILRQREKNLNFNVSLERFWQNQSVITKPSEKITSIVQGTGIPKETVRRKVKNLINTGFLTRNSNKGYSLTLSSKEKDSYFAIANNEIVNLSKFIAKFTKLFGLNLNTLLIQKELKLQFSFYWYHFLSCQLLWLMSWQKKLKDNDLLLVILQTIIPTIKYADNNKKNVSLENIFMFVGKVNYEQNLSKISVSATIISHITGIPRATCVRKLNKLVNLGFLLRETKTKKFYINQNLVSRTKNIISSENIKYTIEIYSKFLSIILTSLIHNSK